jgi:hypothetical protein
LLLYLLFVEGGELREAVNGVATLDNQLFVVTSFSSTIYVFDTTSFRCQQHIQLEGVESPRDIVTSDITRRVYITDLVLECVWSVDWPRSAGAGGGGGGGGDGDSLTVKSSYPANKFIVCEDYKPYTLSVTTGRRHQLLVTPWDEGPGSNCVYVYDFEGKLLQRVRLPKVCVDDKEIVWTRTMHAVQATTGDCYVVCRQGLHQQSLYTDCCCDYVEVCRLFV